MPQTKSRISCLLLLVGCLIMASCSEEKTDSRKKPLDTHDFDLPGIYKRGSLVILAENSSTSFFIYKGKKMGFEYEILKEFAEELGVKLEVKIVNNLDEINAMLNRGEGDIIACNYTVTRERRSEINFSTPFLQTNQVLIQRKLTPETKDQKVTFITDPIQLGNKKVVVWEHSSYYTRLIHLQDEIGDTIMIRPTQAQEGVEELIEQVSNGVIDYTVAERNVAEINERFYDNLDVSMPISFKQNIAFGLNKKSPILQKRLNIWLSKFMNKEAFSYIKRKYFEQINSSLGVASNFKSRRGSISPFDAILKVEGAKYNIDWRLVAALIYHESKFNPNARAFGGAYGLMQFMPGTGPKFGVYPTSPPEVQIQGGYKYLSRITKLWTAIKDDNERNKFILASYNAGAGHILDAQRLAEKKGLNPHVWENNVEAMVMNLGKHAYYTDEVVKSGAFRGNICIRYVRGITARYETYKTLVKR
ncbi:transporter substrate-binding domain-containing protein [Fluviicola chungangensis]|uniref:Transporter substrate-binding domain-containing protein n=1 Tax=Fluviicola chungangensis TaxID=2597671 RepID=A0A556N6Q0_9FLAO|nr:transporter substrate-binding domain-containing protein [Fluviicola chungangensis]TSJ47864.1 transporter substrate-binding domain-containing protein [Fluviicola chungangensis]